MTCASRAARVEKKLNRLDGVTATVNYATEKAKVSYGDGVTPADLIATVEKTGYTARVPEPPRPEAEDAPEPDATASVRQRLPISLVLSVPVVAMAMVPALQFTYWQWLSLVLAASGRPADSATMGPASTRTLSPDDTAGGRGDDASASAPSPSAPSGLEVARGWPGE